MARHAGLSLAFLARYAIGHARLVGNFVGAQAVGVILTCLLCCARISDWPRAADGKDSETAITKKQISFAFRKALILSVWERRG